MGCGSSKNVEQTSLKPRAYSQDISTNGKSAGDRLSTTPGSTPSLVSTAEKQKTVPKEVSVIVAKESEEVARKQQNSGDISSISSASDLTHPVLVPVAQLAGFKDVPRYTKIAPNRARLSVASKSKDILCWDVSMIDFTAEKYETDTLILAPTEESFIGHEGPILCVDWSPNGKQFASSSEDCYVRLWNSATGDCLGGVELEKTVVAACIKYSPKGKFFGIGCSDSTIRIFSSADVEELSTLLGHRGTVTSIDFSPDGRSIATSSTDNSILVWDVKTCSKTNEFTGHTNAVTSVKWSPNGEWIGSSSLDHLVGIWGPNHSSFLSRHTSGVTSAVWTTEDVIWSCALDGQILCWNAVDSVVLYSMDSWQGKRFGPVNHLAIVNSLYVISCTEDMGILIWLIGTDSDSSQKVRGVTNTPMLPVTADSVNSEKAGAQGSKENAGDEAGKVSTVSVPNVSNASVSSDDAAMTHATNTIIANNLSQHVSSGEAISVTSTRRDSDDDDDNDDKDIKKNVDKHDEMDDHSTSSFSSKSSSSVVIVDAPVRKKSEGHMVQKDGAFVAQAQSQPAYDRSSNEAMPEYSTRIVAVEVIQNVDVHEARDKEMAVSALHNEGHEEESPKYDDIYGSNKISFESNPLRTLSQESLSRKFSNNLSSQVEQIAIDAANAIAPALEELAGGTIDAGLEIASKAIKSSACSSKSAEDNLNEASADTEQSTPPRKIIATENFEAGESEAPQALGTIDGKDQESSSQEDKQQYVQEHLYKQQQQQQPQQQQESLVVEQSSGVVDGIHDSGIGRKCDISDDEDSSSSSSGVDNASVKKRLTNALVEIEQLSFTILQQSKEKIAVDNELKRMKAIASQNAIEMQTMQQKSEEMMDLLCEAESALEFSESQHRLEIDALKKEITSLQQPQQLLSSVSIESDRIIELQSELQSLQDNYNRMEAMRAIEQLEAATNLEHHEQQIGQLTDELHEAERRQIVLQRELEQTKAELSCIKASTQNEQSTVDAQLLASSESVSNVDLQQRVNELLSQNELSQNELNLTTSMWISVQNELNDVNKKFLSTAELLSSKSTELEELYQKCYAQENAVVTLSSELCDANEAINELREKNMKLQDAVDKAKKELDSLRDHLVKDRLASEARDKEAQQLASTQAQLAVTNDELRAAVRRLTVDKATLGANKKQLTRKCEQLVEQISTVSTERDKLQLEISRLVEQQQKYAQETAKIQSSLKKAESQINVFQNQQASIESFLAEHNLLQQQFDVLQVDLKTKEVELEEIQSKYQVELEAKQSIEEENTILFEKLNEKCDEIALLENMVTKLQEQVQEAEAASDHHQQQQQLQQQRLQSSDVLIFQNSVLQAERDALQQKVADQGQELAEQRKLVADLQRKQSAAVRVESKASSLRFQRSASASGQGDTAPPSPSASASASPSAKSSAFQTSGIAAPRIVEVNLADFQENPVVTSAPRSVSKPVRSELVEVDRSKALLGCSPEAKSLKIDPTRETMNAINIERTSRPQNNPVSSVQPSMQGDRRTPSKEANKYNFMTPSRKVPLPPTNRAEASLASDPPFSLEDLGQKRHKIGSGMHSDWIRSVSWSPDGSSLATGSHNKLVYIWSVADLMQGDMHYLDNRVQKLQGHEGWVMSLAWSNDSNRLASASFDHTVIIWHPETSQIFHVLRTFAACHCVSWSFDDSYIAVGTTDKNSYVWAAETGSLCSCQKGHSEPVVAISWSPTDLRLASASWDSKINIYSPRRRLSDGVGSSYKYSRGHNTQQPVNDLASLILVGHDDLVLSVAWSRDGLYLASASCDCTIRIWDSLTGECKFSLTGHREQVTSLAFRPIRDLRDASYAENDCNYFLASCSADNSIKLWDVEGGEEVHSVEAAHSAGITGIAWDPEGNHFATVSVDRYLKLW